MKISKSIENGVVTFAPEGWLDTSSSPELGEMVEAVTEASSIVLDFAGVEYMSSAGLRQVLATHKKAKALNAEFSVINVCSTVMSIFKMTNIDKKLRIFAQ
ncbi:MAG: STAS domain-containing protein [Bacteroidales bacterium]|nr:STAS domain-containing protein [Bacteroidales bacterium]